MGAIENMCRLTFHLNCVLQLYKVHSHGIIEMPEVQKCLSTIDALLSETEEWKDEVKTAATWFGP